jgi:hypothetical protein
MCARVLNFGHDSRPLALPRECDRLARLAVTSAFVAKRSSGAGDRHDRGVAKGIARCRRARERKGSPGRPARRDRYPARSNHADGARRVIGARREESRGAVCGGDCFWQTSGAPNLLVSAEDAGGRGAVHMQALHIRCASGAAGPAPACVTPGVGVDVDCCCSND